ncbi:MAG: hypothetical protein HXX19_02360 [Rhodoferax sp.]|nr:hypothetical protein [Rhodoferax sp.]
MKRLNANGRLEWMPNIAFLLVLLVCFLAYEKGLSGPFLFDDGINIVNNQRLRLPDLTWASMARAANAIPNGVFGRPLSMASFALNFWGMADPFNPFPSAYAFKLTNLAIHLVNGLLLYVVTRQIMRALARMHQTKCSEFTALGIAFVVASAWVMSPINLSSVLYVVQRMASLSALFALSAMSIYLWGRSKLETNPLQSLLAMLVAFACITPIAFLCKENGLLTAGYLVLLETLFFRFESPHNASRRMLISLHILLAAIPIMIVSGWLLWNPDWILSGYARRDFNLPERLMTEARVLWYYIGQTLFPDISGMAVFHDDFAVSRGLYNPPATAIAMFGLAALVGLAIYCAKRHIVVSFGILFFLLAHSMESSFIPLELIHEHRNYLASYGVLLAFFYVLISPAVFEPLMNFRRALALVLIVLFALETSSRALDWSSAGALWNVEVRHHPESVRSHIALGDYYANSLSFSPLESEENYRNASDAYRRAVELDPQNTDALFGLIQLNRHFNHLVEPDLLRELQYALQHSTLPLNTNDKIVELAMCLKEEACPVTVSNVRNLLAAALNNPRLQGRDLALIYSAKAYFLLYITHEYAEALNSAQQLVALEPGVKNQMWIAYAYIAMQDVKSAREQLTLLQRMDVDKSYTIEIAEFADKLNNVQ